jgi:hypothetical protein
MSEQKYMPEPFGYFKSEPFGWTDCAETDEGAIPLYDIETIKSISKSRYSFKDAAEYNKRRAEDAERQRDELLSDVERCYRMLLSEPDTKGALFKAENILREAIARAKDHFRDATKMINPESDMIERECCGTFFRTPHRSTCKKYRGKKGGA